MADTENPIYQLKQARKIERLKAEEVAGQMADFKILAESLFSDEQDTRLVRLLVIGIAVAQAVSVLIGLFLIWKK